MPPAAPADPRTLSPRWARDAGPWVARAAQGLLAKGKFDEALDLLARGLAADPKNKAILDGLGYCLQETLKQSQAKLGPEHPHTLRCMGNLAQAYLEAGKRDLALPLSEETFQRMKARLGPDHPHTLTIMAKDAA